MSLSYCKGCDTVIEGSSVFLDDGIGEVECCPYCREPAIQLPEDDPRKEQ